MGCWKTPKTRKIPYPLRPAQSTILGKVMPFLALGPTLFQTDPLYLQIPESPFSKCIQTECSKTFLGMLSISSFSFHILASLLGNQNFLTHSTRCAWVHTTTRAGCSRLPWRPPLLCQAGTGVERSRRFISLLPFVSYVIICELVPFRDVTP